MPKKAEVLSAQQVDKLREPGKYAVGGADGLALVVQPTTGVRSWVLRVRVDGKSTDRKLAGYSNIVKPGCLTLKQARNTAAALRAQIAAGSDPVAQKRAEKAEAEQVAKAQAATFAAVARETYATIAASFKNAKHAAQWISTLETYVFPILGDRPIDTIRVPDVAEVLKPIWLAKPETARRVRQRMDRVFRFAMAHGTADKNPVPAVDDLLPVQQDQVDHHPALPIADMSRFMKTLRGAWGTAARALEFTILTAARSGEVRGAIWREIDFQAKVWNVPAARMKRSRPHTVPLSDAAVALLQAQGPGEADDLIFPSDQRPDQPYSDMALSAVVRRLHEADVVADGPGFVDPLQRRAGVHPVVAPHGFRSSFRDWCAETGVPREVAERALAHVVKDSTEASYNRTQLLEQRRPVMQAWALHCAG
jgi:integrase